MARIGFLSAGRTLGLGFAAQNILMLVRAMLVARLLGPEFFGISVTFLLVVSTFAMISDLGLEKWLIQAREDEYQAALPTLASVLLVRGLLLGSAILLFAPWIAGRFGNPELAWFYACAGIVPIIEGFRHLDQVVQQRRMNFVPRIRMELGGMLPGVLLTVALAFYTRSFVAIAAGSIAVSIIAVAISHIQAKTVYRLGFDRTALDSILRFGWPLMINGILMLLFTQGDRIIIGAMAGMRELAGYAAVALLTAGACSVFSHLTGGLFLPLLSEARDRPADYARLSRATAASVLLIVSLTLVPFASFGTPLVRALYGPEYAVAPQLTTFLALLAASTVFRGWCVIMSLSSRRSLDVLTSNLLRAAGLGGAFAALSAGMGLVEVAASMCAGDLAATFFFLWRIGRRAPGAAATLAMALAAISATLIALSTTFDPLDNLFYTVLVSAATAVPGALAALTVSQDLRERMVTFVAQRLKRAEGR